MTKFEEDYFYISREEIEFLADYIKAHPKADGIILEYRNDQIWTTKYVTAREYPKFIDRQMLPIPYEDL